MRGNATKLLRIIGALFLALGIFLNVIIVQINAQTGQETHPYSVLGYVLFAVGGGIILLAGIGKR